MQGNMYYAFINMGDFTTWSELFNLIEEEPLYQKRVLSFVSGAILPLVALGFIKSLVDYIKPVDDSPLLDESSSEKKTEVDSSRKSEDTIEKKVEDMDIQDFEEDTDHQEELDRASEKGDIKFQESRLDLLEKQPQTNIPANGLINRTVETSSVTLDGTKQNIQRKIKEVKKVNN